MPIAPGVDKENSLREAGFTDSEIESWRAQTANDLTNAGFHSQEIDDYFGVKNPDMTAVKDMFKANTEKYINEKTAASPSMASSGASQEDTTSKEAQSFTEAIEAGWQISVAGLIGRGKKPDVILPEDAPMFYRLASNVASLGGDLPAMVAGGAATGVTAAPIAAATGVGAPIVEAAAIGYGANALPAAMRKVLMDHYEKGDVQDFNDFWERASGTFIETQKQGFLGAATGGVGGKVGSVLGPVVSKGAKTSAQLVSEVATMVTVGKALEGEAPQPQDFLDAAVLVGGLHGVTTVVGSKLRKTYAETGVKPEEIALRAESDPLVRQDLLVQGDQIPEIIAKENGISPKQNISNTKEATSAGASKIKEDVISPTLSEAEKTILSKVSDKTEKVKEAYTTKKLYTDFVDKLDPINEAVKVLAKDPKELSPDANPYLLSRMANDSKAKVKHILEKGTLDFKTLEVTGKSLTKILDPVKDNIEGFEAYLISKRAIEVEGKSLKSGFDLEAAKTVVAEGKGKYEKAAQEFYEFKNKQLEYLKDSGVIGKKEFDNMVEMNKSHVSFSRILEAEKGGVEGVSGKKLGSLKEFKGSDLKIQKPLLSTLENTESIFKAAEKNRAVKALVDLAEKTPGQELISLVEKPKNRLQDNQFEVFKDGERLVYESPKELAKAIKALDGDKAATNVFLKLAQGFTSVKKLALTLTPDFIAKNFFRDQITSGAFSKGGGRPFIDALIAMKDVISKNDNYYNWLKSGGAGGAFLELNAKYLEKDIFKLSKETGLVDKTWNVLKKPVDFLQATGALAEQATRIAEFKRVTRGETKGAKVFQGGFASREVTLDFSRIGAKMSALNAITAFQNVSIQGLDKTIRALKEDPIGVSTKAAAAITLPSVLLWWANKDDERYKQIPRWQKDMFWIIPTDSWEKANDLEIQDVPEYLVRNNNGQMEINKGIIYRVPKPQELGIMFGSLPERILEKYFSENPNALKEFGDTISNLVTPSIVPDAVAPFIEQKFNRGIFTDGKIVPGYLEGIAPEYQYTEYTSESAKQLAKMVKFMPGVGKDPNALSISSPMVIDNYVRSWSGNLGVYALRIADKALYETGVAPDPQLPASTLADIPVIKAFVVRYPSASAQSIQDFYDNFQKQKQQFDTIKYLAKSGEFDALEKELGDMSDGDEVFIKLDTIKEALNTQSQFIRLVNKNPDYTPDDKRQIIDGVYYGMIETAKSGNDLLNELSKALKDKDLKQ